jgi:YesN/AraC family two-component response regulator
MIHPAPISAPIRVCLVDDQRLMRDGLRTLLELEEDLAVVGEAEEGQAALQLYEQVQPDVVLMDVACPVWTESRQPAGS